MHWTIPNLFDVWADCVLHLYLYYGTPPPPTALSLTLSVIRLGYY